jgi:hypothetical protein
MAGEAPPDVVDELYGAPAGEFISRRDAKAKELRKSDRAAADAVKKLRRPSVSAAAVNQLVRRSPDGVEALLAAGEALRQAQLGGGDREAVRSAAHDEREAVERLVGEAGKLSPSALEEVRETLHAVASDDEARELVRRGVLTEARRFAPFFGAVAPPEGSDREAKGKGRAAKKKGDAVKARREREAEAERRRAARERVKAARAALGDAEKAERAAAKALQRAEQEAENAGQEVQRRRTELEAAEEA